MDEVSNSQLCRLPVISLSRNEREQVVHTHTHVSFHQAVYFDTAAGKVRSPAEDTEM